MSNIIPKSEKKANDISKKVADWLTAKGKELFSKNLCFTISSKSQQGFYLLQVNYQKNNDYIIFPRISEGMVNPKNGLIEGRAWCRNILRYGTLIYEYASLKFSEKLTLLTPWYAHVREQIRGYEMLVFPKTLRTYYVDDSLDEWKNNNNPPRITHIRQKLPFKPSENIRK